MKIAFITSECLPFKKTGGLADVCFGLSQNLTSNYNMDVTVYMPYYSGINDATYLCHFDVFMNGSKYYCGVFEKYVNKVRYLFIDNEYFFKRSGDTYGHGDDVFRFGFFCRAVLDSFGHMNVMYDVCHTNDWHTGLFSYILNTEHRHNLFYKDIKLVLTIHNINFQGWGDKSLITSLGLKYSDDLIMDDALNCLKTGILHSYKINTVSPSYRDATLDGHGFGLEPILKIRESDYVGILNGIDYNFFSSETSPYISKNYNKDNYREIKKELKNEFCLRYNLDSRLPLYIVISRITDQKGLDLLVNNMHSFLQEEVNVFVLGDGDKYLVDQFINFESYNNFRNYVGYNEALAHQLYAAGDYLIMPSKFEPCGLSQMIACNFGCIAIVNDIHGLHDSIIDYNEFDFSGTGLKIYGLSQETLLDRLKYSVFLYYNFDHIDRIRYNAFRVDFSFDQVSARYLDMYN